jgi:hypothetical protein
MIRPWLLRVRASARLYGEINAQQGNRADSRGESHLFVGVTIISGQIYNQVWQWAGH